MNTQIIDRIKEYCTEVTNAQWEELVRVADEVGITVYAHTEYNNVTQSYHKIASVSNGLNRIPVPRFLDLLHDRIVPWRLEEIGFQSPVLAKWKYELTLKHVWGEEPFKKPSLRRIRFDKGEMSLDNQPINISKFTDLLSLIRFLTPPPEET